MKKKQFPRKGFILITIVILALAAAACGSSNAEVADVLTVGANGSTSVNSPELNQALSGVAASDLSQTELEGLLLMREEEKLARDVYLTLFEMWGLPVLENISNSEQTHTEAVLSLLERYGVSDPALSAVGEFNNQDLQALYDQLVEQGSLSIQEALMVGAAIEEIDILDLEELLAQTDNADIQLVYENLLAGSQNHLRSFANTLSNQTGISYSPQYLSLEEYAKIMSGTTGNGAGRYGKP